MLGDAWKKNLDDVLKERPIDLIICTGDVANWGLSGEYDDITSFFAELTAYTKVGWESLYVIPGNHDINRKLNQDAWVKARQYCKTHKNLEIGRWVSAGFSKELPEDTLSKLLARKRSYLKWLSDINRTCLRPSKEVHPYLGYRITNKRERFPFPIHILGLDSTWLCGDDNDDGNLRLTDSQIMQVCSLQSRPLPGLRIALMHHPLHSLADYADAKRLLADYVDVLFRGHLHDAEAEVWTDGERKLQQFVAGCLYEGELADKYGNSHQHIRIELDEQGKPLGFDLWVRTWSSQQRFWYNDNSQSKLAKEGKRHLGGIIESNGEKAEGENLQLDTIRIYLAIHSASADEFQQICKIKEYAPTSVLRKLDSMKIAHSTTSKNSYSESIARILNLPSKELSSSELPLKTYVLRPLTNKDVSYAERSCDSELFSLIRKSNLIAITGTYQIGKTSLLNRISNFLTSGEKVLQRDITGFRTTDSHFFLNKFFRELGAVLEWSVDDWDDVRRAADNLPCDFVLIIDELGCLSEAVAKEVLPRLRWLAEICRRRFIIIAALPTPIAQYLKTVGLDNPKEARAWKQIHVEPFDIMQLDMLLALLPKKLLVPILPHRVDIMRMSNGHPRAIQCLLRNLVSQGIIESSALRDTINNISYYEDEYFG